MVLLICFVALLPFLLYPDLPQETDAELHIYRLAELSRLVRGGEFYPRWSPHFYYGYGYPIFNYYAPLGYYTGLLVEIWPVFNAVLAIKFVFMLGLVLAGLGMYGFVRDFVRQSVPGSAQWCRPAGYVAAAVYVYAPYIQYVDPHARGDLAESFSFGLFPLALWALHRFARTGRAGPWLAACFAIAAVILSHNLMAMVFFGLLTGWVLWQYVIGRGQSAIAADTPSRYLLPVTLLAGVGLAAFFWLPVALEQEAVNLSSLIGDGSHFDFRNHFLTLGTLLGFSPRLDWGATEQVITFNLGVMQWVIGLLGAVLVMSGRAGNRRQKKTGPEGPVSTLQVSVRRSEVVADTKTEGIAVVGCVADSISIPEDPTAIKRGAVEVLGVDPGPLGEVVLPAEAPEVVQVVDILAVGGVGGTEDVVAPVAFTGDGPFGGVEVVTRGVPRERTTFVLADELEHLLEGVAGADTPERFVIDTSRIH